MDCANQALRLSKETGRKQDIGWARNLLGLIYREQRKWQESIENFRESISVFEEIGFESGEADSHYELGLMWKKKGDLAEAKEHLNSAVEICERLNLTARLEKATAVLKEMKEMDPHAHT